MIESGIFFALLAFLGFGIGDTFATHLSRYFKPLQLSLLLLIFTIPFYLGFGLLFASDQFVLPEGKYLFYTLAAGLCSTIGLTSFYKALSVSKAGVVVPIANSYALLSVLLSVLLLGNLLTLEQWLAVCMVILGIFFLSLNWSDLKRVDFNIAFAFLAFFSWGLMTFFMDRAVEGSTPLSLVLAIDVFILLAVVSSLLYTRTWNLHTLSRKDWLLGWVMAWMLGGGFLAFAYGFSAGFLGIIALIGTASPLLTAILSHYFLADRLKYYQYGFIIMIIAGVALLSLP